MSTTCDQSFKQCLPSRCGAYRVCDRDCFPRLSCVVTSVVQIALAVTIMAILGLVAMLTLGRSAVARWPVGPVPGILSAGLAAAGSNAGQQTPGSWLVLLLLLSA